MTRGTCVHSFSPTIVLALAGTLGPLAHAANPVFSEQTMPAGITHTHSTIQVTPSLEFMVAGGAVGDFDRDGDQDLFILGGSGGIDKLYINDGNGNFTDEALSWGVFANHRGSGAAVGDYDNDGDLDIFVSSLGPQSQNMPGHNRLYRNNGDHTFTNVAAAAGVMFNNYVNGDAYSAAFGDYDLDGDLDLFVAGWLGGNRLFNNKGDGTFEDVSANLDFPVTETQGFTPRFVDMNDDRYPEILLSGDFVTSKYLINNTDGTFTNATPSNGTGLDSNGMGNTYADFNNDGLFDWYVTSLTVLNGQPTGSGNMLYQQTQTPHIFQEIAAASGCNDADWSWGADAVDFNHDGFVDIIDTNGYRDPINQDDPTLLYMNDGSGNFTDQAVASGIDHTGQGRGLLTADFDNDGDRDILILCNRQQASLYRNDLPAGPDTHSVTIRFDTSHIPALAPDGFGTRVALVSDNHTQLRYLDGGSNYLAQSELSIHAGIGSDDGALATITYANGATDTLYLPAGTNATITAMPCPADFSPNGALDIFDVFAFLDLFNNAHPQADLTDDGNHDIFDVFAFLSLYNAGCPPTP
ncbi:MAG: CRTAC1 family protein [Phycisphaerales bacterium]|nr:CRTAC1 family protein [Phycisphaerales bacterium]